MIRILFYLCLALGANACNPPMTPKPVTGGCASCVCDPKTGVCHGTPCTDGGVCK